jgi:hypothetical protein
MNVLLAVLLTLGLTFGATETLLEVESSSGVTQVFGWKGFSRFPGYFGYRTEDDSGTSTLALVQLSETQGGEIEIDTRTVEPKNLYGPFSMAIGTEPHNYVVVTSDVPEVTTGSVVFDHRIFLFDVGTLFEDGDSAEFTSIGGYKSYSPLAYVQGAYGMMFIVDPDSVLRIVDLGVEISLPTGFGVFGKVRSFGLDETVSKGRTDLLYIATAFDTAGMVITETGTPFDRYPMVRYRVLRDTYVNRCAVLGDFDRKNCLVLAQTRPNDLFMFDFEKLDRIGDPVDTLAFDGEITALTTSDGAIWVGVKDVGLYRLTFSEDRRSLVRELVYETGERIAFIAAIPARYEPDVHYIALGGDLFEIVRWHKE